MGGVYGGEHEEKSGDTQLKEQTNKFKISNWRIGITFEMKVANRIVIFFYLAGRIYQRVGLALGAGYLQCPITSSL